MSDSSSLPDPSTPSAADADRSPHDASQKISSEDDVQTMSSGWKDRLTSASTPLLGIAAWSGTGKTTLLEQLLPALAARGLKVAVIKHAHHAFDVDTPGKDSHRLRSAGAAPMLVASAKRFAMMMETPDQPEADLEQLVAQLDSLKVDLILVEGFKQWPLPKLELYRETLGKPLRALEDRWIHALATPGACMDDMSLPTAISRLDLDDVESLAAWVSAWPVHWRLDGGKPRPEVNA